MPRIALASSDAETLNGRAANATTFVTQLARLLRENGDDVSIILAHANTEPMAVDARWREKYRSWGIELIELNNKAAASRVPDVWLMSLSEQVAPILPAFDVVYFTDRANVAFHTVRVKRFTTDAMPVCVTVLLGPSQWVRWCAQTSPRIPEDLNLDFVERYSAWHSDFVVAPSQSILDWAKSNGWQFSGETEVLGLPYRPATARRSDHAAAGTLERLALFGPIEGRAGFGLLVRALAQLFEESPKILRELSEVILFDSDEEPGVLQWVRDGLKPTGLRVTHLEKLDGSGGMDYLAANARGTLAVILAPARASPYAAIEASSISDLSLLCARGRGIPEILPGIPEAQLFDPSAPALAAKLRERLETPLLPEQLARYDHDAANRRWLAFHARVCDWKRASLHPAAVASESVRHTVDVCVTYYNKARHFPQLLKSLECQTTRDFGVIVVDDGSPDAVARAVFDAAAEQYGPRGWTFFRQPNRFAGAARNQAAKHARAEYLLMLDADDVPALNAVERMLEAARLSGDDCLVSASCLFLGDEFPFDPDTGELIAPTSGYSMPLGVNLAVALMEPAVLGGPMILIRRKVFETIGGYRELRGAARGDRELLVRLALAGYKTDVLPEYLHFYRQSDDGLSHACDRYLSELPMIETYERHLAAARLPNLASALHALYDSREAEEQARYIEVPVERLHKQFRIFQPVQSPLGLKRFASDDEGPALVRLARRAYRGSVPLDVRLRLHRRLLKLIRRDPRL